ncbi:MAG: class I SAM-dependent methyltransferase [Anaerolineae bacterium]
MKSSTVHRLNAINRAFYAACAVDFDVTRAGAWRGWGELLPSLHIPAEVSEPHPYTVLDVGCGNGRLGVFLAKRLQVPIHYHGLDNSETLLNAAHTALSKVPNLSFSLDLRDVVETPPDAGAYNLVAAMGILHHIPGVAQREQFVRALADRVAVGGRLVWTEWRFAEYERFRERMIPMLPDLVGEVEPGDYLLDWGGSAGAPPELSRRYCHAVDDAESERLIAAAGLPVYTIFRSDGHTRDANRYVVLHRP